MQLPVDLKHTEHKHGGKIERIDRISHGTNTPLDGRSRDFWYFIGAVKWDDGGYSDAAIIEPFLLCARGHDGKTEVNALCEMMNDYLREHGTWSHEGKHQGWYANERPKVRRRA